MATVTEIGGERLLKVEEVSRILGVAVGTLNRARMTGAAFPAYVKTGKSVRYKLSTVTKWLASQVEHSSTSEIDARKGAAA